MGIPNLTGTSDADTRDEVFGMPLLVRRRPPAHAQPPAEADPASVVSPREHRLYVALTVIVSLNIMFICGVATFCALLFKK